MSSCCLAQYVPVVISPFPKLYTTPSAQLRLLCSSISPVYHGVSPVIQPLFSQCSLLPSAGRIVYRRVSYAAMLDVLIVGGGPHALTLSTLLAHPDVRCPQPSTDILDGIQLSQTKSKSGWSRGKRRPATAKVSKEEAAPGPTHTTPPLRFRVVDSYGEWAALWGSQFSALNIPHLRSHTLVHTDPLNKKSLQDFVVKHGRSGELHCLPERVCILDENAYFNDNRLGKRDKRRLSASVATRRNLYFSLPATRLSVDFFQDQVDPASAWRATEHLHTAYTVVHRYGLDSVLIRGTVDRIIPVMPDQSSGEHKEALFFRVLLQGGEMIEARRVVMATGPTRAQMANIPAWVSAITESYPEDRLQHTVQLMHQQARSWQQEAGTLQQEAGTQPQEAETLQQEEGTQQQESRPNSPAPPPVCHTGERMLVIGGGLTSAHVISIALQQGAGHVTWLLRKHLQLKQFDVGDVESLIGRYSHVEHGIQMDGLAYLRRFYGERSLPRRLAMIRQARKGGAVTPEAYAQLVPNIQNGRLDVKPYCQVSEAKWCYKNQAWSISLSCGEIWTGDRIWLATGCKLDVNQDPLLADVIKEFPIQVLDGWPCLSDTLQWASGCPLYLMGQYAALQIGPHVVNLAGGQASSMRIAKDILGWHKGIREGHGAERTRTEEYIQQMHGLMWL
ncbi:hypothetical protein SKAU_G00256720 [Synaphobranchus kaupii]|uniref:L-ornithine N(5)-oxygenase n=1 Tax=Synaphobranchus kaupii TaxID=118154 RepID=A0A9Q1ISG2_SYNKA|nr:hypothetical protein SKAU_G00256720 [Synaphobranchus kaupii]